MKTLRLIILAGILLCLSASAPDRTSWTEIVVLENAGDGNPCVYETMSGQMEINTTVMQNESHVRQVHVRYKCAFTGDVSGDLYTVTQVESFHAIRNEQSANWSDVINFIVHRNGKPILRMHVLVHGTWNYATWNEKGWAAYIENYYFECL